MPSASPAQPRSTTCKVCVGVLLAFPPTRFAHLQSHALLFCMTVLLPLCQPHSFNLPLLTRFNTSLPPSPPSHSYVCFKTTTALAVLLGDSETDTTNSAPSEKDFLLFIYGKGALVLLSMVLTSIPTVFIKSWFFIVRRAKRLRRRRQLREREERQWRKDQEEEGRDVRRASFIEEAALQLSNAASGGSCCSGRCFEFCACDRYEMGPIISLILIVVVSFAMTLLLASTGFFESQRSDTPAPDGAPCGCRSIGSSATGESEWLELVLLVLLFRIFVSRPASLLFATLLHQCVTCCCGSADDHGECTCLYICVPVRLYQYRSY